MALLPPFPPDAACAFGRLPAAIGRVSLFPAAAGDLAFLRRLYRSTREDELALTGWSEAAKAAFCDSQFALQHGHFVGRFPRADFAVIRRDEMPVGRLYADGSGESLHLIDIALMPAARGEGTGASLLRALQARAAAAGKSLTLNVQVQNRRARALYERLGFVAGGAAGAHIPMRWPS